MKIEAGCSSLIEKGCPVDAPGFAGQTALHVAVKERHAEIAEMLLKKGANIVAQCSRQLFDGFL